MPQPNITQIPSSISTRGVGRGVGGVGGFSRYQYQEQEDPRLKQLRLLAALQGLDVGAREADRQDTANMLDMAKTLYGIRESQQLTPAKVEEAQAQAEQARAHASYYGELPAERTARAMESELRGLYAAFPEGPQNKDFVNARNNILKRYNVDTSAPPSATPQGAYGPGSTPAATPATTPAPAADVMKSMGDIPGVLKSTGQEYNWLRQNVGVPVWNFLQPYLSPTPIAGTPEDKLRRLQQTQPDLSQ